MRPPALGAIRLAHRANAQCGLNARAGRCGVTYPLEVRKRVGVVRLLVAAALATGLAASLVAAEQRPGAGHDFLAYFATQSSILAIFACALSGAFLLARGPAPAWVHPVRAAAVSYALVLVVTRLLIALPWQASSAFPIAAVNVFLMLVAPLLLLADWVLVGDRRPLSHSFLRWIAAFPVLWSSITLLRGIQTGWTPYPLLSPATAGVRLPLYLGGTILVSLAAGAIVSWLSRQRALLPMDPAAQAVETAPTPMLPIDLPPLQPPTPVDSPPVAAAAPILDQPAAPREAFRFVEPPETSAAEDDGTPPA